MVPRRIAFALLAAVLAMSACSATQPTPTARPTATTPTAQSGPVARYTGFVSIGSNLQAFGPCDQSEQWWIADRPQELTDRYLAATTAYHPVYVVIEGNLDAAQHGPDGTFNRELWITRLVAMDAGRNAC